MRIIAKSTIREDWLKNPQSKNALWDLNNIVRKCDWENPNDVKKSFANASIVANKKVVFNIRGNS